MTETANAVITTNGWKQNNKGDNSRSMHWLTEGDKSAKNSIIYSVHAEIYLISRPAPTAHNLLWWLKIPLDMNDVSLNCTHTLAQWLGVVTYKRTRCETFLIWPARTFRVLSNYFSYIFSEVIHYRYIFSVLRLATDLIFI